MQDLGSGGSDHHAVATVFEIDTAGRRGKELVMFKDVLICMYIYNHIYMCVYYIYMYIRIIHKYIYIYINMYICVYYINIIHMYIFMYLLVLHTVCICIYVNLWMQC